MAWLRHKHPFVAPQMVGRYVPIPQVVRYLGVEKASANLSGFSGVLGGQRNIDISGQPKTGLHG
jgi:hypothetical protein